MIIDISCTVYIDSKNVHFVYIGEDDKPERINGKQWEVLSEKEQKGYIVEDVVACMRDANELEFGEITCEEES